MINRSLLREIDWGLIGLLLSISALGAALVYSSSFFLHGNFHLKQIVWGFISLVVLFLVIFIDYKALVMYSVHFYVVTVIVLVVTYFFAGIVAGTRSWIQLASFQFQPSEVAKVVVILVLAHVFSEYKKERISSNTALLSGGIVAVPFFLVAVQPDLGTAVCFLPPLAGAMVLAGLNRKAVVWLLVIVVLLGVAGWHFYLKDYQKQRLSTLIFPQRDPQDSGYQLLQSKIAVGSGGLLGKGFKKGTQSQLRFLPARHTDFIFAVLGEEFGFAGVTAMMFLYLLFLFRLFSSAGKSRDRTGVYLVFMISLMLSFQFFINVMMVVGLFPITGIPIPLLSYGGSSLLSTYIAVGLVINVKMRRFTNV